MPCSNTVTTSNMALAKLHVHRCLPIFKRRSLLQCTEGTRTPMSVLYLYDNIYEIHNVIHSLFTVKLDNVTIKTWNIWLVKLHMCNLPPDSQWSLLLCAAGPQSPVLLILLIWRQGWGQFRNWNWNWYQIQFQELELKRNWIKGIGIDIKELIEFLFLIVNSFWFFLLYNSRFYPNYLINLISNPLNTSDRTSLDKYIILYGNLSTKWILCGRYWLLL